MIPRSIIRPLHIQTTPAKLAEQLGIEARKAAPDSPAKWGTDFFMYYPPTALVNSTSKLYMRLRDFYKNGKLHQRTVMVNANLRSLPSAGFIAEAAVLPPAPLGYIVRPLIHEKGQKFRRTLNEFDFTPGKEYISPIFPKTHEYRVIFVRGKFALLQKKQNGKLGPEDCWSNVPFTVIKDVDRAYLFVHTDVIPALLNFEFVQKADIVGVDILYNHAEHDYRICELNCCPCLTAPGWNEGRYIRQQIINQM